MTMSYDDPYNLVDPEQFRASYGFLFKNYDSKMFDTITKKLNF